MFSERDGKRDRHEPPLYDSLAAPLAFQFPQLIRELHVRLTITDSTAPDSPLACWRAKRGGQATARKRLVVVKRRPPPVERGLITEAASLEPRRLSAPRRVQRSPVYSCADRRRDLGAFRPRQCQKSSCAHAAQSAGDDHSQRDAAPRPRCSGQLERLIGLDGQPAPAQLGCEPPRIFKPISLRRA